MSGSGDNYPHLNGCWAWLASIAGTWVALSFLIFFAGMGPALWFSGGFMTAALIGLWEAGRNALRDGGDAQ